MKNLSGLQQERLKYVPTKPKIFDDLSKIAFAEVGSPTEARKDQTAVKKHFPNTYGQHLVELHQKNAPSQKILRIGVVLSGGQAPGGHSVIAGIYDALKEVAEESRLIGFINGPSGIVEGKFRELKRKEIDEYRNTGGFDLIGSGRTKIETNEQLHQALSVIEKLQLDGLVVVGGDDSNTNAAVLAEFLLQKKSSTKVIGVPKTIDGDLKNEHVEISFGFDSACKVYAEMIGNIAHDAISARKYYHFVKLMGRSASHIALECALSVQPNLTFISEEIKQNERSLQQIVDEIADLVIKRAQQSKNYGVILIPEGLIEFIPEMKSLITSINQIIAGDEERFNQSDLENKRQTVSKHLEGHNAEIFGQLPFGIQKQLLLDRDPHGNVQVSKIATEKLLLELVQTKIQEEAHQNGSKFSLHAVEHFFGYEGRSGFPSNFDCDYCYALGIASVLLIRQGLTGYMSAVKGLTKHPSEWKIYGIPITALLNLEIRHGNPKPVIQKALVDLSGKPFRQFSKKRESWKWDDEYIFPGPTQYFGPAKTANSIPQSLVLEHS